MEKRNRFRMSIALMMASAIALLSLILLMVGNTHYSIAQVFKVLSGENIRGASFAIGTLRLPRMLAGLLVGLSFGFAGSAFQTILRNPLASPDIIGITSGSSAAAVFCIVVLNISGLLVSISALAVGFIVSALIYWLSGGGSFSGGRLILIGIGVQAMLNAAISYMLINANQYDVPAAMRWLTGSLNSIGMSEIPLLFTAFLFFGSVFLILGKYLEILELGESVAISLGVRTNAIRMMLMGSSVALIAFSTAITGPVAFVAFLSGPIARKFANSGNAHSLISGLVGALIVLGADFIGQFVLAIKLPAGVITGMLGAPYLILQLIKFNRSGGAA